MIRKKLRAETAITSEPGFPVLGVNHYLPYLQQLHKTLKPKVYFEIGTESGASLSFAECTSVAVDPQFQLQSDVSRNKPELHQYQGTSDDFFASRLLERLGLTVDLAFLDGLHLFEFLLRDFINTEPHMAATGTVTLHDCVPFNHLIAGRDWDKTKTASWTGDVWKVITILREYRPDLQVEVLKLAPTGLVSITNLDPANTVLRDRYDEIVARYLPMSLADFGLERFGTMIQLTDPYAQPRRAARKPGAANNGIIAIKTCVPDHAVKASWGDYHFAQSLAQALERAGHRARVDIMADWAAAPADDALDIVLQGHDHHPPRDGIPSLLWLIYPGKRFGWEQLASYDHVFVGSAVFAQKLARRVAGLAPSVLHQAFDAGVMSPAGAGARRNLVFVANNHFARGRPIAEFARKSGAAFKLWGRGWEGDDWAAFLQAEVIANDKLGAVYGKSAAVLCDHTAIMARNGFLSNRVFDALACGVPVIMDVVAGLPEGFADLIHCVDSQATFEAAIDSVAAETTARRKARQAFAGTMKTAHSFDARARQLIAKAEELSLL